MSAVERIESVVEQLRTSASVETVYGDPIERGEKTVVPVASVGYGFGGGWGTGGSGEDGDDESGRANAGSGGGLGGGAGATPVGVLEITDDGTRFVRFDENRRAGAALFAGLVLGFLLRRR